MHTRSVPPAHCRNRLAILAAIAIALCLQTGCTRSLRQEGAKVAQAGTTTAKQLGDYYDTLTNDTIRNWELGAYSLAYATSLTEAKYDVTIHTLEEQIKAETDDTKKGMLQAELKTQIQHKANLFLPPQLSAEVSKGIHDKVAELQEQLDNEKRKPQKDEAKIGYLQYEIEVTQDPTFTRMDQLARVSQRRYQALVARKLLASEMQGLYDNFGRLADYNAEEDVRAKAGTLLGTVKAVLHTPVPDVTSSSTTIIGRVLGDAIKELENVQQSRAIRRESKRILPILHDLQIFFDNEKAVYKSIATTRASFSTQIAKELVENKVVISTALVNDVLAAYELHWPEPQTPFEAKAMISGIVGMMTARSKSLEKASQDTADSLSNMMTKLIKLHEQLLNQKPLTFGEFLDSSGTVQLLLEQLKAKGVDSKGLLELLKQVVK